MRSAFALRHAVYAAFLAAILPIVPASAQDRAGEFDFYVLSLSWSPTFCALEGGDNRQQCGSDADFGFIVHGLWPQYEQGFPEFCETRHDDRVPRELGQDYFDIMPSMGLIGHQWRKHGSCTGLSPDDYLELTREAFERLQIPDELDGRGAISLSPADVETTFLDANSGLSEDGLAATCSAGALDEVRICLTKDLDFRACREVDARGCRQRLIEVPAR
ncbi:ribonuclease [Rhizobium sp. EC-SD404]|uniref:ribonuclease T2 family protein n=1 Tax=Rhizobium sp. EC-SD404 TaxID=2038389 RepID=UPI001256E5F1|nr:ribonuclease [Rhizobium sp. EC-SD404]VVT16200.1 Ribonuclease T2 [Rhizobium sp. EC-SD404]